MSIETEKAEGARAGGTLFQVLRKSRSQIQRCCASRAHDVEIKLGVRAWSEKMAWNS